MYLNICGVCRLNLSAEFWGPANETDDSLVPGGCLISKTRARDPSRSPEKSIPILAGRHATLFVVLARQAT